MQPSLSIEHVHLEDLPEVVRIHEQAFPDAALTKLGTECLVRYYRWQLTGPHQITALAVRQEGVLVGFCVGGVFRGSLSGFLDRNRSYLVRRLLTHPSLMVNPIVRDRIGMALQSLRRLRRTATSGTPPTKRTGRSFGILSIAVLPGMQGRGIGSQLLATVESTAQQLGFDRMHLSVHSSNHRAVRVYERNGWTTTGVRDDLVSMVKSLTA